MMLKQSSKLRNVSYDVRGPVLEEAARMEAEGHRILKLNIGNPAPFGFEAPDEILVDFIKQLPTAQGYSESKGIPSARRAVAQYYQKQGLPDVSVEDVYLGNGVSELIQLLAQALVDNGDEVLVPMPDYPLWTASVTLAGGKAVHYELDEDDSWFPNVEDIAAKVTDRTKAIVVINPNNPTGAVYPKERLEQIAEVAREHDLLILSDEIYDKILYDDAEHHTMASIAPDLLTITFNGLSKAYRVAGFRAGWMMLYGPKDHAADFIEGLTILSNMRLCANVPAQHVIATALGGYQTIDDLVLPGGRLREQRDVAYEGLMEIPGVSVNKPAGALYMFPRLDLEQYPVEDDEQLAYALLREKKILVTQGTGFNYPRPDHFRLVTLPDADTIANALDRIGDFLAGIRR
ncbi:pyridoxal phosphate-dependent aminotransferase [Helcobacillus massiliensis]|uniref:pyridoxal phosphate-dependent aminotransferase n=1 Tax=Helcobacillus massiliensis TaxID=521392 RepID=UPI0021A8796F|nr:pyridoxal phosphate-dependent aminotransferase [Helcobacillus massiliensis]MCT1557688.1 pyridoxal phosphate-dependent aminotransferase [Helcobacillus massiliensis]MCT2035960.1 pyridoxal phosphate-dependent aminotransferase [Helcobacillus massiliensis]MCT2331770.1 pyridoxal phosphate-dependent aminotransferase [Helcobacillus massiliensis]